MSLWLLIPVKPFTESKSRLAGVLAPHERTALSRQLLHDVLARSHATRHFDQTLVISRDPAALALAGEFGAATLRESAPAETQTELYPQRIAESGMETSVMSPPRLPRTSPAEAPLNAASKEAPLNAASKEVPLNAALVAGRDLACAHGAQRILVLPADLPLLTEQDLDALVTALSPAASTPSPGHVVLAPSHDGGTNALGMAPPHAIDFAFGAQSFARHRALAQAAGCTLTVVQSSTLDYDLDLPEDLWGEALGI